MPLFAKLFGGFAAGLTALLSTIMGYQLALKLAAYTAWMVTLTAWITTMLICVRAMWNLVAAFFSGGGSWSTVSGAIAFGLGVIVPSNAGTVLACCSSVWLGTCIYKIQKHGITAFGS